MTHIGDKLRLYLKEAGFGRGLVFQRKKININTKFF